MFTVILLSPAQPLISKWLIILKWQYYFSLVVHNVIQTFTHEWDEVPCSRTQLLMNWLMYVIRLVSLTSVYVNPGLWLVNLAVLVYLPLTRILAKGKPAIESERKNISTWYNFFNSWSNHAKLSDFYYYIAVLGIWKLERKLSLHYWKTGFWIFALYKSNGFFFLMLPSQRRLVGKRTERISRWRSPTKRMTCNNLTFWCAVFGINHYFKCLKCINFLV